MTLYSDDLEACWALAQANDTPLKILEALVKQLVQALNKFIS